MLRPPIVGAGIVIAGAFGLLLMQSGIVVLTGKPSRDICIVLGVMELVFYVWVRVFSRLAVRRQVLTLSIFVGSQLVLLGAVRLDGFSGDGRPLWVWRWSATPEDVFEADQKQRPSKTTVARIDLSRTTPGDSPGFRGADRTGRVQAVNLESDWRRLPPKELWRKPVGRGWSSFAVVGEYCVTQEQRRENEVVVCYEVSSGREVWVHRDRVRFHEPTSDAGPRATPTIDGGRVYALGATGILNCLNGGTGARLWSVNILETHDVENRIFGMVASPIVMDGLVIVCPGGVGSSVVAYDAQTGKEIWSGGDADASYSSPQSAVLLGSRQVLNFNAEGLFAHDVTDGAVLWSLPWISNIEERNNVCQPLVLPPENDETEAHLFLASGYGVGCARLAVRRDGGRFSVRKVWANRHLKPKFSSVVVRDGFVYGLDGPVLTCLDLETGQRQWKAGRYGCGQLLLVDDLLLVQMESGAVALVGASPAGHRELGRFTALDDRTWNHPVLSGPFLLVRNDREAACYELKIR